MATYRPVLVPERHVDDVEAYLYELEQRAELRVDERTELRN